MIDLSLYGYIGSIEKKLSKQLLWLHHSTHVRMLEHVLKRTKLNSDRVFTILCVVRLLVKMYPHEARELVAMTLNDKRLIGFFRRGGKIPRKLPLKRSIINTALNRLVYKPLSWSRF